jgi:hypothetical protein
MFVLPAGNRKVELISSVVTFLPNCVKVCAFAQNLFYGGKTESTFIALALFLL